MLFAQIVSNCLHKRFGVFLRGCLQNKGENNAPCVICFKRNAGRPVKIFQPIWCCRIQPLKVVVFSETHLDAVFLSGVLQFVLLLDAAGEETLLAHVKVEALKALVPASTKSYHVTSKPFLQFYISQSGGFLPVHLFADA